MSEREEVEKRMEKVARHDGTLWVEDAVSVALDLLREQRGKDAQVAHNWIRHFGKQYDADGIKAAVLSSWPCCAPGAGRRKDERRRVDRGYLHLRDSHVGGK